MVRIRVRVADVVCKPLMGGFSGQNFVTLIFFKASKIRLRRVDSSCLIILFLSQLFSPIKAQPPFPRHKIVSQTLFVDILFHKSLGFNKISGVHWHIFMVDLRPFFFEGSYVEWAYLPLTTGVSSRPGRAGGAYSPVNFVSQKTIVQIENIFPKPWGFFFPPIKPKDDQGPQRNWPNPNKMPNH